MLVRLAVVCLLAGGVAANWNEWWTYDGISGPAYWGLINPAWTMCNKVTSSDHPIIMFRAGTC